MEFLDLRNCFIYFLYLICGLALATRGPPIWDGVPYERDMGHLWLPTCPWQAVGSIWELGVPPMTLLAPRELGLSEIPGEGRVWCSEGCGSTAGLPALAHEKWPHCPEAGYPQMTLDFASLCSLLSLRACLSAGLWPLSPPSPEWRTGTLGCFEDSVLKILFRKHRGNFSSPFPFPGIVDPMKKLTPLLLVTKWLVDMSPLTTGGY